MKVNQVLSKIIDGKPFARQAWFEESPSPAELTRIDSLVTEIRAAAPEDRDLLFQRHWPRWHLHGTHDEKLAQAGVQRERGRGESRRGEERGERRRGERRVGPAASPAGKVDRSVDVGRGGALGRLHRQVGGADRLGK